jgi:hypothetical protein
LIILRFIIKNTRTYKIVLASTMMLLAIPIGIAAEISIHGCCGSRQTGPAGVGLAIGAALLAVGIIFLLVTLKTPKR